MSTATQTRSISSSKSAGPSPEFLVEPNKMPKQDGNLGMFVEMVLPWFRGHQCSSKSLLYDKIVVFPTNSRRH
ncbi:hypothetical protein CBM2609_P220009 [Cupriavidus taiwanensis]|uniref:Uncharacterized protein n=1 Tax=Cupriavidus taiwanensis TaxID=164546 RepID=A0A375DBS7_9BURK|nr:hypothetical protein [Cupriavidus taiwanensis]SOZ02312.1 hypothetical protein CBM2600_P230011 [Cupriavidus taiwanensis]SOZ21408.1 hypothetical protein CBM2604_P220011 [Cupriavidus taiwanensis]SOZ33934.1 hypothetical protein CBM2609_P220009 [Cupriavidus taiwanensis]SOZ50713.1 hypothetical protein CBM2610_P200013 [Cupriavidus taiwanensis]SOZ95177.1 hypothetical protein CBM2598_P160036 [Cupriavidus taiwanensis]